ncbi:uncharacterized protein LOC129906825 isoform X2 [Episyrphus balteatus]|uniref:uncharacterized protein LOC129906825 isoform X2 n=1 Tax=Episyrphus balteatus TaxID=286459 RepID=UPI00248637AD|nr:uncharacterized protein LOC129906825 isoform X2 [Episyrphus balteatus]
MSSSSSSSNTMNYKVPSTSKISVDKLLRVGYYELEKTIGKGNFAVVKLASNIVTKTKVAIKIIDKTCLNEEYLAKTFREIAILKEMHHPHITRLYEVMESQTMIYLVTEHAAGGEIFDHLVENGRMKEPEAARVFTQLVSAVQYCHSKGVVHRDLKAENVLLDKDMNIKLADFGFSNRYNEGTPLKTWCGSPPYAAPEVFQGLEYDGPKADIWSLGVVLYALVCGALPFDGKTLLDLKSKVVLGKFRIPYFMSQDCESLIRNMLVVEPDRRYTLKQIIKHRWLSEWSGDIEITSTITRNQSVIEPTNLDSVVMTHMLQLPGLTADMIAQSVHENRFDKIYAIYNLLNDKLQEKRREQQRLQHHANLAYSRSRKTSITTGVVDRSEPMKQESADRLSPLTNASCPSAGLLGWTDVSVDLENFGELELECLTRPNEQQANNQNHLSANNAAANGSNTRRHTVGPGDVAHEQALANPNAINPINFKCPPENEGGPYLPMNLPMLQNQPLHNLTIKDQHLLKPPTVMGATGAFGRRASDGGANLRIYYPSSMNNVQQTQTQPQMEGYYTNTSIAGGVCSSGVDHVTGNQILCEQTQLQQQQQQQAHLNMMGEAMMGHSNTPEVNEESSDEIQRYMQARGCSKRHTVGCTDDISATHHSEAIGMDQPNLSHSPAPQSGGGGRTRRTGLLTVMDRPPGRYSPVRRASEGSKAQFQGPLQECQYLQKGIAQRNFLVAPSPPLLENSISLPGSPIHGRPIINVIQNRGQNIEVPQDAMMNLVPALNRLVKEHRISGEIAKNIVSSGLVPLELAQFLGLIAHSGQQCNMQQQMYSYSVNPLSAPSTSNTSSNVNVGVPLGSGMQFPKHMTNPIPNFCNSSQNNPSLVGQFSNINLTGSGCGQNCGCQSPVYNSFSGCSSPNPYIFNAPAASSPMHQITKGFSVLTTSGGGGSITRGTSAAIENASNQPLDLSMDVCSSDAMNSDLFACPSQQQPGGSWFIPPSYYDLKPLNLSPAQPVRIVPTPPASPNLCIIQEENANGHISHTISAGLPYGAMSFANEEFSACQPSHPQICLTDVQGSEITLVALSSENSRDSDCDSLEPNMPSLALQGLIITEPSNDMPSITRGVGRKASLESENNSRLDTEPSSSACGATSGSNRRGSDKSLGFSDDSLSNDSNNLSPCQEPSASSGFKSDSHSEIGDQTEGRMSPDSICDSRMSDECYEVPLPHECSNLDSTRILQLVKQTIDSTMPPKGFVLNKGNVANDGCEGVSAKSSTSSSGTGMSLSSTGSGDSDMPVDISNLSLEYSGGLQIELQVCEGRNKDNKGIKLRRISGDQFEYGKLCQQLISTLNV